MPPNVPVGKSIVENLPQCDFGLNVQEAGDASRWQHEGDNEPTDEKMENGGYVELESGIPYETAHELRQRGHDVRLVVDGADRE